tara:strand:- start:29353 stop:29550 length:198 start_codon:yes stop_codon:yes gene_type:complete
LTDWDDTRRNFRRIAAKEGVRKVAKEVPANHVTAYRIISGETTNPSQAIKQGIERVVESRKDSNQ